MSEKLCALKKIGGGTDLSTITAIAMAGNSGQSGFAYFPKEVLDNFTYVSTSYNYIYGDFTPAPTYRAVTPNQKYPISDFPFSTRLGCASVYPNTQTITLYKS